MAKPVDEECGRAVHTAANAAHEIFPHAGGVELLLHLTVETLEVEGKLLRVSLQIVIAQVPLILVQQVMHLPKSALCCRRLGGLRSVFGVWMRGADRKVAKDKAQ